MMSDLVSKLNSLYGFLTSSILGQEEPLAEVVSLLQRSLLGLRYPNRPVASMLFLGPTGVGKTETVNLFTQHLFGSLDKLVRLDMSEYMTIDSINVLRGVSGMKDMGLLGFYTMRSRGSGVLLFDEIEKAHPLILDVFLQILSAGHFTDATGCTNDLSNYIVVATSNIGANMLMESRSTDHETIKRRTFRSALTEMRPETFARFDLPVVFNKLDYLTLKQIANLHCTQCFQIIWSRNPGLTLDESVVEHVQREGYSEQFGARPTQAAAMRVIGGIVAEEMLRNGGNPVSGVIQYDRKTNECFLE